MFIGSRLQLNDPYLQPTKEAPRRGGRPTLTAQSVERLKVLWVEGRSRAGIASDLDISESTVTHYREQLNLTPRPTQKGAEFWTEARKAELKTLWNDTNRTAQQIADHFNTRDNSDLTKNAIIGQARRVKANPRQGVCPADILAARRRPEPKPRIEKVKMARVRAEPKTPSPLPGPSTPCLVIDNTPLSDTVVVGAIPQEQLAETGCKWPLGDPKAEGFGFCGCEAQPKQPYCLKHSRNAYEPSRTSQGQGARGGGR